MTTVNALLYKHFRHQQGILEGNADPEVIQNAYDKWSNWCVIAVITPKYIRIELPNKTQQYEPVNHYKDCKILKGLWVAVGDYHKDIDQFFWCKNWVQAILIKWIMRVRCKGPYLIHIIHLGGD